MCLKVYPQNTGNLRKIRILLSSLEALLFFLRSYHIYTQVYECYYVDRSWTKFTRIAAPSGNTCHSYSYVGPAGCLCGPLPGDFYDHPPAGAEDRATFGDVASAYKYGVFQDRRPSEDQLVRAR